MNNIPYLAAHLEKRAGKEESFDIIKRAINGELLSEHDWAVMYSYFMPPSPKKITNPFEWATMICDQKESYAFCKYVLVEKGKVKTANTKTAHVLFDDLKLESGWYDIKKGPVGDDIAVMPNVDQAIEEASVHEYDFSIEDFNNGLLDIVDAPVGLSYILPWNNKGVEKKYFDLMIKSLSGVSIMYSFDGPFRVDGFVGNTKACAVIMPFKVNGLIKEEKSQEESSYTQLTF